MAGKPSSNGSNLEKFRKAVGMSQGDLAKASGMTVVSISRWELGRVNPSKDKLVKLAEILHCDWKDLVD